MANWSKLTDTEKALVIEYLQCMKQTEAYRRVFTDATEDTVQAWAYEPFNRPHVKEVLSEIFAERVMQPSEVLERLQEIARGKAGDYISEEGTVDFTKLQKDGKGYLLKRYKDGRFAQEFEFVDYQRTLETLAKITGLLDSNKVSVTINNETSLEDKLSSIREKLSASISE